MEAAESNDDVDLFKNIRYYVVGELPQSTKDILSKAKSESYLSALATHVLVTNPDHYEVEAARDIWQIPTVTPRWVELSHKCNTLLPTNGFSPSVNQLFIGFVFTFSNLVRADKASLWSMVTYHGGKCQTKLDKHCTHLVTAEPSGAKYTQSLKHENISIVAPDWITDCIKLNTKCDPAFYHPKLNTVATVKQVPESEVTKVAAKTKAIKLTTPTAETPSRIQHPTPPATQQKQVPIQEQVMTAPHSSNRSPMNINNPKVKAMEMQNQQQIKTEHQTNLHMQPGANQPRFPMQNHQIPPSMVPAHNMMPSTHNYNMMNAQNFGMVNQQQQQQQQMMMSPGDPMMAMNHQQFMMMSPHVRPTTPSPRRGSTGGKKKKNVPQQVARPTTPHNIRPPQHFPQNQLMFSHQMHLQNRMPGSVDHQAMMQSSDAKQNLQQPGAGVPGRHLNPVAMQQGENFQLMQMQQQQQQQQQQQMRMNLMHQTSPRPHVNTMDQKWPRTSMDQGFVPGHHQQMFPNPQQQSPNLVYSQNQMIRQPNPAVMNTQPNQISHQQQQYNSMMMNRQVNPQQIMYQQRSPNTMNANRFPTSTSLEAAGMSGISPIALQEGLMKAAQTRPDQPALIHPSLQGTLFPKGEAVPPAGQNTPGTATKKRGKSRKKIDGGEEEVKPRSRQRTTKAKKGQTIQTPMTPTNMMQTSPGAQFTNMPQFPYQMPGQAVPPTSPGRAPHTPHQAMMSHMAVHPGNFPTTPHPPHLQSPTMHQYPRKPNPPMMATSNIPPEAHQWPPQQFLNTNNNPESPKVASLSQTPMVDPQPQANKMEFPAKIAEEPIVPARRPCIDPLACQIKDLDTRYMCRDPAVKVTPELCLLGCVFYIFEYDEVLTDLSVIDVWKKMIGKYGGVVENTYTSSCTHVICLTCTTALFRQALMEGKRCVTIYWLNDVLQIRNLRVPWLALHLPTHFSHKSKPATNHTISYTGFYSKERERLKMMAYVCGAKFTGYFSKSNTVLICKNPDSLKCEKAKEWSVVCVSLRWLRDLLQSDTGQVDLHQPVYQKFGDDLQSGLLIDLNKARGLLEPWRKPIAITPECLAKSSVKRKFPCLPQSPLVAKRARQEESFEALPRVCFTGFSASITQDLTKKLESLNAQIVTTLTLCTHLVARNISRTVKFLCCVSSCSYVVTPQWIEDSFRKGVLLDEDNYWLSDKQMEEKFKFTLQGSVLKAKASPLFKDCLFCITEKVVPEKKTMKQIIECAGGRVLTRMPSISVLKHMNSRTSPNNRVFVVSCNEDEATYLPIRREGIPVYNAEIVLTGVLKQTIDMDSYRL